MCGSLKLEGEMHQTLLNGIIPASHLDGIEQQCRWTGWARIDGSRDGSKTFTEQWPPEKVKLVTIKQVVQFTERDRKTGENVSFNSEGRQIAAVVDNERQLRILTRSSKGEEKKIHSRMPVTVKNSIGRKGLAVYMKEKLHANY